MLAPGQRRTEVKEYNPPCYGKTGWLSTRAAGVVNGELNVTRTPHGRTVCLHRH